ncbi:uncharacterized protein [Scyliorhinus torazame]|uniref:uncharacterized protein n=1 Tax=Scyliorhinus torazame TaxID=75743 RepID=UPI003B5C1754
MEASKHSIANTMHEQDHEDLSSLFEPPEEDCESLPSSFNQQEDTECLPTESETSDEEITIPIQDVQDHSETDISQLVCTEALNDQRMATHESRETTSNEIVKILTPKEEHQESRETTLIEILKILTPEEEDQETKDDSSEPEIILEEEYQGSKADESNPSQMTDVTNINATSDHSHNSQEEMLNVTDTTKATDTNICDSDSHHPNGTLIEHNSNNENNIQRNKSNNNTKYCRNKNNRNNKNDKNNNKHNKKHNKNRNNVLDEKNKNNSEKNKNRNNKHDENNNKNDNENYHDRNDNNETTTCTTWYNSAHEGQCHSTLQNNGKSTNMPWHSKKSREFTFAPQQTGKPAVKKDDMQNQYRKHKKKSRSDNKDDIQSQHPNTGKSLGQTTKM